MIHRHALFFKKLKEIICVAIELERPERLVRAIETISVAVTSIAILSMSIV